MAKENNNKSFVLRIDAATMEALEGWAADEFRSINGQLQWIIADALRRSGRLKKPRPAGPESGDSTGLPSGDAASAKPPGSAPERLSRRYLTDTLIDMCNLLSKNRIGLCGKLRGSQSDRGMSALRPGRGMSALCPVRSVSGVRPGRGVSGLRPGQGISALRPVRSVSGLRPVLGVSGLRPGRNMSGLRYGRIVSGLQVVGGLLVFFLLLRPDWLPRWVYWGVLALGAALALGEMALDYRRRRPRRRWRDAGLVLLSLSVVWIVILPPFFFWGVSGEKELTRATLGLGVAALVACVVCLLRWRRLRAEAEMRLWKLNAERRRRDMLCARAAAEGGGR